MYFPDFWRMVERAAYRSDLRVERSAAMEAWGGIPPHLLGVHNGIYDHWAFRRGDVPAWIGPIGNVKYPMIPEWTEVEDVDDPDAGIHAIGWRLLLKRWLQKGLIRPTTEIREAIGRDFYRYLRPEAGSASSSPQAHRGTNIIRQL